MPAPALGRVPARARARRRRARAARVARRAPLASSAERAMAADARKRARGCARGGRARAPAERAACRLPAPGGNRAGATWRACRALNTAATSVATTTPAIKRPHRHARGMRARAAAERAAFRFPPPRRKSARAARRAWTVAPCRTVTAFVWAVISVAARAKRFADCTSSCAGVAVATGWGFCIAPGRSAAPSSR